MIWCLLVFIAEVRGLSPKFLRATREILIRSGQDFCHASPRNINYLSAKDFDRTSNHEENKTKDGITLYLNI